MIAIHFNIGYTYTGGFDNEAGNEEYSFIAYFEKENDLYSVTLPAYPQIKMSGKNKRDIIYHLNDEIMRLMFEDEYTAD